MHRKTWFAICLGIVGSIVSLLGQTGTFFGAMVANFAMLPLVLAGLAGGTRNSFFATLSAAVVFTLLTNPLSGGIFVVIIAFPSFLIVHYALMNRKTGSGDTQWYPFGNVIAASALYGAVLLIGATAVNLSSEESFQAFVERILQTMVSAQLSGNIQWEKTHQFQQVVAIFPGTVVGMWLIMVSINSTMAQAMLTKYQIALRPTPEYSKIVAPEWLYWALVGSSALSLLGDESFSYLGRNLAIVFGICFFYIGLGIVHRLARRLNRPKLALTGVYFFSITMGWPLLILAILGFFEQWLNLRRRFT